MRRVTAGFALCAAAILLVTGCGGAKALSKTDYTTQMTTIGKNLTASFGAVGDAKTSTTAATGLTRTQADLRDVAKKLDDMKPPKDVKDAHQQLSSALSEFADELDPVIPKLKAGNTQALTSLMALKGQKDVRSAADTIAGAGYDIGNKPFWENLYVPLSKSDYTAQMTTIGTGLTAAFGALGSATTAATAATGLARAQTDLRVTAKKLGGMAPPRDVKDAHQHLSSALSEFADELDPVIPKIKAGNAEALTSVTTLKGLKDIEIAADIITGAGYAIGSKPFWNTYYVAGMATIGKDLSTSISTLSSVTTAKSAATGLVKVQADIRSAVKQIDALAPPDDAKAAHARLGEAIAEFGDELTPIIAKLKAGNLQALRTVTSLKGLKDIQTAAAAISKAGYAIGG